MSLTITVSTLSADTSPQLYALVRAFAAAATSRCGSPARSVVAFGAAVEASPDLGRPMGESCFMRRVAALAHAANRAARRDHDAETPEAPAPRMIEIIGEGTTCLDPGLEVRWTEIRWTTPYHTISLVSSGEDSIVLTVEAERGDGPSDRQAAAVAVLLDAGLVDLVPSWALPDGDWVQIAPSGVITAESSDYHCPEGYSAGSAEIRKRHGRVLADLAAAHFSTLGSVERYPTDGAHHGMRVIYGMPGVERIVYSVLGDLWQTPVAEVLELHDRLTAAGE